MLLLGRPAGKARGGNTQQGSWEKFLDAAEQQKKELFNWIPQESRFSSWSETGSKAKWLCRKLRAEQRQRLTLPVLQHPVISDMFPSGLPTAYKNNST